MFVESINVDRIKFFIVMSESNVLLIESEKKVLPRKPKKPLKKKNVKKRLFKLLLASSFNVNDKQILMGFHAATLAPTFYICEKTNRCIEFDFTEWIHFLNSLSFADLSCGKKLSDFRDPGYSSISLFKYLKPMKYRGNTCVVLEVDKIDSTSRIYFNKNDARVLHQSMAILKHVSTHLIENKNNVKKFIRAYHAECYSRGVKKLQLGQLDIPTTPDYLDFTRLFLEYPILNPTWKLQTQNIMNFYV